MAVSQPTLTVGAILSNSLLYSQAGIELLEVWSCLPIAKSAFKLLPQEKTCTSEVPISFTINNQTSEGYMNLITLVAFYYGNPTDCSLVASTPIKVLINIYTRITGELKRA